jgi:hypothetical protein
MPPTAQMEGFELISEGIITLGKVEDILENYDSDSRLGDSPAEEIVKLLLQHDVIDVIVGTRINWAHQDPEQPLELELRKYVVKRIIKILRFKFFKKVMVEYI